MDQNRQQSEGCMQIYNNSNGPLTCFYRKLFALGFVFGVAIAMAIVLSVLSFNVVGIYNHVKTHSIPFQLRSLDLASNSANSTLAFSVRNPLPDSVYFHVAKASVSYKDRVVGFKLMDPFRVMMGESVVFSVDLSPGDATSLGFGGVDRVVGFEFRVEGLVKIHDDSVSEEMGSVQVVCGRLEVRFSSSVGVLAGGPRNCRSSWEYF